MTPSPMRDDHHRSKNDSTASATAAATTRPASRCSDERSPSGMASSMIDRSSSGGARFTSAAPTMVMTKPTSIVRYGRATPQTRLSTSRPRRAPLMDEGSDPRAMWGDMRTRRCYGRHPTDPSVLACTAHP